MACSGTALLFLLINIYFLYLPFFVFLMAYPCYAFKKYTDTSKLLFPDLIIPDRYDVGGKGRGKVTDQYRHLVSVVGSAGG
jgi:hypothetical protein